MFHDHTDFNSANWNGWQTDLGDEQLGLVADEGGFYLNYTVPDSSEASRVLLSKVFGRLQPGKDYVLSVRLSRGKEVGTGSQHVHFCIDGVAYDRWEIERDEWQRFVLRFKASKQIHTVELRYEYEAYSSVSGGNFVLDDLNLYCTDGPEQEVDRTDFDTDDWNGWERETNGLKLTRIALPDKQYGLGFDEPSNFLGGLIRKSYALKPGAKYELRAKARLGKLKVATVTVLTQGGIEQEVNSVSWQALAWPFIASTPSWWDRLLMWVGLTQSAVNQKIGLSGRNKPTFRAAGLLIDDLSVYEVFDDTTDFVDKNYNGWQLNPETTDRVDLVQENGEGYVLNFPTHPNFTHHGIILSKIYRGLASGVKFEFTMRVRSNNAINEARLSVSNGTEFIIDETWLNHQDWREYRGIFEARGEELRVDISNSNPASVGNDYRFSTLRCVSIDN